MKLLIYLLLFSLVGCATNGPAFSKHSRTKPEYSRIYFYRPSEGWYDNAVTSIYIDDKVVRNIRPGQVTYIDIDSAPHTLRIKNEGSIVKTLFFDIVPMETAQAEMDNLEVVF